MATPADDTPNDATDADLATRVQAGDEAALVELVRRYQGPVRVWLARACGEHATADDLAQEVFVAAWREIGAWSRQAALGAWLMGIARHRFLRWRRDAGRLAARHAAAAEVLPGESAAEDERLTALRGCLERLDAPARALIDGCYRDGEDLAVLATRQGRSAGALRVALFRLRQALRTCVEKKMEAAHG
jgi:RNA polymerase sigma-70 factor (ECF subfamily)